MDENEEYLHQTISSHIFIIHEYISSLNFYSTNLFNFFSFLNEENISFFIYSLIWLFVLIFFFVLLIKFSTNRIGFKIKSNCELKANQIGIYAVQGRRPYMEDKFNVYLNNSLEIIGLMDGHGGDSASTYVQENLLKVLTNKLLEEEELNKNKIAKILTEQVLELDKNLCSNLKNLRDIAGTTALIAVRLIHTNELVVANIGDSRGVLCDNKGKAIALSFDHKPNHPKEWKRIYEVGGFVKFNGVWRVGGILATSRALGDYPLKEKNYVIANPDILTFDLNDLKPKFAIFASDGLWDIFTNEAAVKFIKDNLEILTKSSFKNLNKKAFSHELAKRLTNEAYNKGSTDNITVAVWIFDYDIKDLQIITPNYISINKTKIHDKCTADKKRNMKFNIFEMSIENNMKFVKSLAPISIQKELAPNEPKDTFEKVNSELSDNKEEKLNDSYDVKNISIVQQNLEINLNIKDDSEKQSILKEDLVKEIGNQNLIENLPENDIKQSISEISPTCNQNNLLNETKNISVEPEKKPRKNSKKVNQSFVDKDEKIKINDDFSKNCDINEKKIIDENSKNMRLKDEYNLIKYSKKEKDVFYDCK